MRRVLLTAAAILVLGACAIAVIVLGHGEPAPGSARAPDVPSAAAAPSAAEAPQAQAPADPILAPEAAAPAAVAPAPPPSRPQQTYAAVPLRPGRHSPRAYLAQQAQPDRR